MKSKGPVFPLAKAILVMSPFWGPLVYFVGKELIENQGSYENRVIWGLMDIVNILVKLGWFWFLAIPITASIAIFFSISYFTAIKC